jgi:hypothetical protein
MKTPARNCFRNAASTGVAFIFLLHVNTQSAQGYASGSVVGDMRQPPSVSGGTACPQRTRFDISNSLINRQWSNEFGFVPNNILTLDQTILGQIAEVEAVVRAAFDVWTGVAGSALTPASMDTLQQTDITNACVPSDGVNSICFSQKDSAFTAGVLAFTRVVSADTIGERLSPSTPPSTFVGQILDADVLLRPGDPYTTFATPEALPMNPTAYDLQSILTHELGHFFGFSHSAVWDAVMFPFAPPQGKFNGIRPTPGSPDAPLADDDRAGIRALYPDPLDTIHIGRISGRVLPASPLSVPFSPQDVTGVFPAQVVAVDTATGAIAAAAMAGWSCADPGPAQFDGSYSLEHLAVGPSQTYQIYAEPLDGPVTPDEVFGSVVLCRSSTTEVAWPPQFDCIVPPPAAPFSARIRPRP